MHWKMSCLLVAACLTPRAPLPVSLSRARVITAREQDELSFDPAAAAAIDFSGTWSRIHSEGLEESLAARGLSSDEAKAKASADYVMKWERRKAGGLVWRVTAMDGTTPRRTLEYEVGNWEENIPGGASPPFDAPGVVARYTTYVPVEKALGGMVHFTRTASPSGCVETVSRYLVDGGMVCSRFVEMEGKTLESLELFRKD